LILNYLTNIAFYLCLKASGTSNIRDHPVIGSLVELRTSIEKAEAIEKKLSMEKQISHVTKQLIELNTEPKKAEKKNGKINGKNGKVPKKIAEPVEIVEQQPEESEDESEIDEDHIDVPMIEEEFKSMKKANKKRKRQTASDDFQDLDALDTVDIEDKVAKKRSLRDYVAKIDTVSSAKRSSYGDGSLPISCKY
jgi:U3 small nucleolar RNA-associated protein 3